MGFLCICLGGIRWYLVTSCLVSHEDSDVIWGPVSARLCALGMSFGPVKIIIEVGGGAREPSDYFRIGDIAMAHRLYK